MEKKNKKVLVLGSGALAAVGATSSVQLMILGFCTGACAGFCVPIAQRFGAQDYKGMRSLLYNSILLVGILSAGLTVLCVLLTNIILHILSIPVDIWDNTYIYILIMKHHRYHIVRGYVIVIPKIPQLIYENA